jgi:hypothetical protein
MRELSISHLEGVEYRITKYVFSVAASISTELPLLVQRCNGTTAWLGYLEVLELSMKILLLGQLASVCTVNSQWGRRIQYLYWLKPNTITSIQLQCIQGSRPHASSRQITSKPQPKFCMYQSSLHQPPYCTCTFIWNKYPKRAAVATNYLSI